MEIRKQGSFCQVVFNIGGTWLNFMLDTYENRKVIREWLDNLISDRLNEKITSIHKKDTSRAILYSIQNKTDRLELELTERDYLKITVVFRNPNVTKYQPDSVLEFETYVPPFKIASELLVLSPDYVKYSDELNKILGGVGQRPSLDDSISYHDVFRKDMIFPKKLSISQRTEFINCIQKCIPKLSDVDLITLREMIIDVKEQE